MLSASRMAMDARSKMLGASKWFLGTCMRKIQLDLVSPLSYLNNSR